MTKGTIIACFDGIKRSYFPRWDVAGKWKVEFADSAQCRSSTGYCDSRAATIFLDDSVCGMTDAGTRALLIHEICHDVAAAGHNLTWARRMECAAKRAVIHGDEKIAEILRSDIYSYCNQPTLELPKPIAVNSLTSPLKTSSPNDMRP